MAIVGIHYLTRMNVCRKLRQCIHIFLYFIILNLVSIVTMNIGLSIMSTAYFIYTMLLDLYIRNTMHLVENINIGSKTIWEL